MLNAGKIFGCARVSTDAQDLNNQAVLAQKADGLPCPSDVVVISAVDRLSRDTTGLLVIARNMQRAGAGLRSLAEPVVDTTSDFAGSVARGDQASH
jgi:23S rRNA-/tRNA-specific pseudouridylate synthase